MREKRHPYATAWLLLLLLPAVAWGLPTFQETQSAWHPSEAYLLDRNGQLLHELRLDFKVRRLPWTSLEQISPALISALLLAEDRRFQQHHGVDWRAMAVASFGRLIGKPARGASTLTMQLAAMLEPSLAPVRGRRTFAQKLAQIRAALTLEETWSKPEILEAYLNLVGFRGELQGVAATARVLFGKQPSGLAEDEALLLAAVLPSPNAHAERIGLRACAIAQAGKLALDCAKLKALAAAVLNPARPVLPPLQKGGRGGFFDRSAEFQTGQIPPNPPFAKGGTEQMPPIAPSVELAPHLARHLLKTPGESVRTSLDENVQRLAFNALDQQLRGLAGRNVRDGAALVVDNQTGEVLAYVGSAGPFSKAGKVDGVRAKRQAGSTLKPFLYGTALEKRYLTAASVLDDAPVHLETPSGLYIPQNYDHDFKGQVSVRTALASSLNVPAVRTLVLLGVERFRDRLRDFGFLSISQPGEYYGFSLALGSAEVSLWEQINAYRTLANSGIFSPLLLKPSAPNESQVSKRVLDEAATFILSDILADRAGRAATFGLSNPLATRFWTAVKTGTSKDMRDNWCIGFSRRYTVGVWVGNFEGDSMHEVSGVTGAAPAWLEIMNSLQDHQASTPPEPPAGLVHTDIRFEPAIEPPRGEWLIPGTETGVVRLAEAKNQTPHIESPANGVIIALDPDIPYANQAVLFTAHAVSVDMVFMLDGKTIGKADTRQLWRPKPGLHKLVLAGQGGKVLDTVAFSVRGLSR